MAEFHLLGVSEFKDAVTASVARKVAATREVGRPLVVPKTSQRLTTASPPRVTPTSSRPGEPPSLISGTLRRSVQVQGPTSVGGTSFTASTGPTAVYGRIQELGGVAGRGSRLPARPYVQPGVTDAGPELRDMFQKAWSTW